MGFSKRQVALIIIKPGNQKETQNVTGYVYGDNPVVVYHANPVPSQYNWAVSHIATGAVIMSCTSIERARRIVKEIEEKHHELFSFAGLPKADQAKSIGKQIEYMKEWRGTPVFKMRSKEND